MLLRTSFSNIFQGQTFAGSFCIFFPHLPMQLTERIILGLPLDLGYNMMALIDRKFNEEQLLLETFFPKMHVERNIREKLIFKFIIGVKTSIKKSCRWGCRVLICCLGHHSRTFFALKILPSHFLNFPLVLISFAWTTLLTHRFRLTIRPRL